MGEGEGTPWMSRQLIAGPLLTLTSGAILFSILLKDTLACSSVPPQGSRGLEPATFQSLVDQLYPMSYSRPSSLISNEEERTLVQFCLGVNRKIVWGSYMFRAYSTVIGAQSENGKDWINFSV